jgi:hypothetical protein
MDLPSQCHAIGTGMVARLTSELGVTLVPLLAYQYRIYWWQLIVSCSRVRSSAC